VPYPLRPAAASPYRGGMNTPGPMTVPRAVAAKILGIAHGTLRNWAAASPPRGPRPTKTGTTKQARTLYALEEIKVEIESHRQELSTV